jgi:hypothetical protein
MASTIIPHSEIVDIETIALETRALLSLSIWIEQARLLIKKINVCAGAYPEIAAELKKHDVRFMSAHWGDEAAGGLIYLIQRQRQRVSVDAILHIAAGEV